MVDDRNLTVHTNHETIAQEIFNKLESYCELMTLVVERIGKTKL